MKGKVYLVGAGPGDYGLLTLKGLECIKKAEVIVYDRLANEDYLKEAKEGCEFIYVGKVSSNHTLTQDEINQVIMEKAKEGKIVTRLKGGDPYVFGRGGEEGEYLLEHGVAFEVVPGITSAIGGLCYAGIPITHRDYTSSFHVVTGHLKDDENTSINWNALAHMGGTIVFLMGISNLAKICANLMTEGMPSTTSVAVINWATRPNQKVVTGNLETICEVVAKGGITSPSLIVVGEVVKLREKLNFFEERPFFGKTIVTTRARAQSSTLKGKLQELGAKVIEFPTICIKPLEDQTKLMEAVKKIETYTYLVFTSQNAVSIFFETLYATGKDGRALSGTRIVAVGNATKEAIKKYGIVADMMPERFIAESVCDLLEPQLTAKDQILIPKATKTRDVLQERLSKCCEVDEIEVYENVIDDSPKEEIIGLLEKGEIDAITFTSASTVKNFMALVGDAHREKLEGIEMVSIGAITSETMRQAGLEVYVEPERSTIDEMIQAMLIKRGEEKCE